jgi:hypothetical protein
VPNLLRGLHGWRKKTTVRILPSFVASRIRVGGGLSNWAYLFVRFRICMVIIVVLGLVFYYHCYFIFTI